MGLISELKRRNVHRVAAAYTVLAWLVIQVADTVAPAMSLPDWTLKVVIWVGIIGFPLTLVFSWLFELTPQGLMRDEGGDSEKPHTYSVHKINAAITVLLIIALLFVIFDSYVIKPEDDESALAAEAASEQPGAKRYDSIAVLPFINMSEDPGQTYLSDGLSEELLNLLAKLDKLKVAARTSSFAFRETDRDIREIGEALNVSTVLEGSIRKAGNRIRITAQLIDAADGYHLWSDSFDRELEDIFAIQDEISAAIVAALKVHLSGEETGTGNAGGSSVPAAYDAYLRGRHLMRTRGDAREALELFREATELDPAFAEAWSSRAEVVIWLLETEFWGEIPRAEAYLLAETNIERALQLDPTQARAYAARGMMLFEQWQLEKSLESLDRAIAINPNLADAYHTRATVLSRMGRIREARETLDQALALDPMHRGLVRAALGLGSQFYDEEYFNHLKITLARHREDIQFFVTLSALDTRTDFATVFQELNIPDLPQRFQAQWRLLRLKELTPGLADLSRHHGEFLFAVNIWINRLDESQRIYDQMSPERQSAQVSLEDLSIMQTMRGECSAMLATLDRAHGGDIPIYGTVIPNHHRSNSTLALNRAFCLKKLDRGPEADRIIRRVRTFVDTLRDNASWGYHKLEAKLLVLEGNPDQALEVLSAAQRSGELFWVDRYDPIIQTLSNEPRYGEIYAAVDAHIDAERAKLGMPPADLQPQLLKVKGVGDN